MVFVYASPSGSPTPATLPAGATSVTIPLGDLQPSTVTGFQIQFRDNDSLQPSYTSPALVSVAGVVATSGSSSATQATPAGTTITGSYYGITNKTNSDVAGSHNRLVDWTVSFALPDLHNTPGYWGTTQSRVVDNFPTGAVVTISTGWTCTGSASAAAGTQCIHSGGQNTGGGGPLPTLEVSYPSPTFAEGYVPTNVVASYVLQNGAPASSAFDPANPAPVGGPWVAVNPSNTSTAAPAQAGNGSSSAGAGAEKLFNESATVTTITNGTPSRYDLKSTVTGAAQDYMTTVDDFSGSADHFILQYLQETLSPAMTAVNPSATYTFTFSDNSTTSVTVKPPTTLYFGKPSDYSNATTITVPTGTHPIKMLVKYFVDDGSGNPKPGGLPVGAAASDIITGMATFVDALGGSVAPVLHNCMTTSVYPAASTDPTTIGATCAQDITVVDGLPIGPANFSGTVTAGTSPTLALTMLINEPVRTINGLISYIELPPGIQLAQGGQATSTKEPIISTTTYPNPNSPGNFIVKILYGPVTPNNTYTTDGPDALMGFHGYFDVSIPLLVSAAAYNPPSSDSEGAPNWASVGATTLAGFGGQYFPQRGSKQDVNDINGNGNSTEYLPEESNNIVVLSGGNLVGNEFTAATAAGPFSTNTVVPAGTSAVLQNLIKNNQPNSINGLRIYQTLPAAGDASGSQFTPMLTGPPTGVPTGATVEYSTSSNPCTMPADPNPVGCSGDYSFVPGGYSQVKSTRITVPVLATNTGLNFQLPVTVPGTAADTQIAKSSFVMYGSANGSAFGPVNTTPGQLVAAAPNLTITKTSGSAQVVPGKTATYKLQVVNSGAGSAAGAVISDTLVAGLTFVSDANGVCSAAAQVVTCAVGVIAAGATNTNTITVNVADPFPTTSLVAGNVSNTASVTDTNNGNCSAGSTDVGCTSTVSTPLAVGTLEISKTVDNIAPNHGDKLTYTILVKNTGAVDAKNVSATDTLPTGLMNITADNGGVVNGSTITWTLASVPAGSTTTLVVTGNVPAGTAGLTLTNTFGVLTPNRFGATTVDQPCTDSTKTCATSTVTPVGSLQIDKTVDKATAAHGDVVTYTLTIKNTGSVDGSGVTASDVLPAGVTFVSATGGGTLSGSTVSWSGLSVPVGTTTTLTVTGMIVAGTAALTEVNSFGITNPAGFAALVVSDQCSSDASRSCATTTVAAVGSVAIDKKVDKAAAAHGDTLTYTVSVQNTGSVVATNVAANDVLPAGVTFVSASGGGTLTGSTVNWTISSLAVGATSTFTVVVTVDGGTASAVLVNSFGATNPAGFAAMTVNDQCTTDATRSCATTAVGAVGSLQIDKTVDKTTAAHGDVVTYTLTMKNTGSKDGTDVAATDILPADVTFVSATNGGTLAGSTVSWSGLSVPIGATTTLTVTGTIATGTAALTEVNSFGITNPAGFAALVVTDQCASDATRSCATTTVAAVGSVTIDKSVDKARAGHGETLTYTVTVQNTGSVAATNVAANDVLPAGVTFVSASGGGILTGSTVNWTISSLAVGATSTFTAVVTVDGGTASAVLVNSFGATNPAGFAAMTVNDQCAADATRSCAVTTIGAVGQLQIDKTAAQNTTPHGGTATYTVTVKNTGSIDAINISAADLLPAGLTFFSATGGGTLTSSTVNWTIASLTAGSAVSFTVVTTVDPGTAAQTLVDSFSATNPAGFQPVSVGHACAADATSSCASTTVPAVAVLTLLKTALTSSVAKAGTAVNYQFSVSNTGDAGVVGLHITDTLVAPAGPALTVNCPQSSVAPKETLLCTASYVATQADVDHGSISNSAVAAGLDPQNAPIVSGQSTATISVVQTPAITVVKTANRSTVTAVGQQLTYSFVATNNGNLTLTGVVVADTLTAPAGPALVVNCPKATLAPAESMTCTAVYSVTSADIAAGKVVNSAAASGVYPANATDKVHVQGAQLAVAAAAGPGTAATITSAKSSVTVFVLQYGLFKSDDVGNGAKVKPGQKVTYTIKVPNTGGIAVLATLTDQMSGVLDDATFNNDIVITGSSIKPVVNGTKLTWTGTIPVEMVVVITYSFTVKPYAQQGDHQMLNVVAGDGPVSKCATNCTVTNPVIVVLATSNSVVATTTAVGTTAVGTTAVIGGGPLVNTGVNGPRFLWMAALLLLAGFGLLLIGRRNWKMKGNHGG